MIDNRHTMQTLVMFFLEKGEEKKVPIKLLGGWEILMWFCFAFRKVRPFNTLNYDRNLREKKTPPQHFGGYF